MRYIELTQGKVAIVDDEDFERVSVFKWYYGNRCAQRNEGKGKKRRTVLLHHMILPKVYGLVTDHINCDPLDNRRCNLRYATQAENTMNRRKIIKTASFFKGVARNYYRWRSRIMVDGKLITLGNFKTEIEAALAYNEACKNLHGEFANLNDVESYHKWLDQLDAQREQQ